MKDVSQIFVSNNNAKLLCHEICLSIASLNNIKLELVTLYNVVMTLRRQQLLF